MEKHDQTFLDVNDVRFFLLETAKWAKFIAIVGYIFIALLAVFMLLILTNMTKNPYLGRTYVTLTFFIYAISIAISYFPISYLYKFATKMNEGLRQKDKESLVESFYNLKLHYKFAGILLAIVLALNALTFIYDIFIYLS